MQDTSIRKLCVGLPVYNGETFLPKALDSMLAQDWGDFEIVVCDNASTDATPEICRAYGARDSRIRYERNERNIGANANFNRVFQFCRSPYFKWMVHDDLMEPSFLGRCIGMLEADPEAVLAHSAVRMIDEEALPLKVRPDGMVIGRGGQALLPMERLHLVGADTAHERFDECLRRMSWCTALQGVIRADALRRSHLFGPFYGGDFVLLAELALLGKFRQAEEVLYLKRVHSGITVHKGARERERWANPGKLVQMPGLTLRLAYFKALEVAELTPRQRRACLLTAARVAARNPLLYKLLPNGLAGLFRGR